jgi:hypothetical protein
VKYIRLYADDEGISHFEDLEFELSEADYAPPAAPLNVSAPVTVTQCLFFSVPQNWDGGWHPAPRRQFWMHLAGEIEVEAGDGERRRFGPGSVALVEDVSGEGHVSRVVGHGPAAGVFVQLPE